MHITISVCLITSFNTFGFGIKIVIIIFQVIGMMSTTMNRFWRMQLR